MIPVSEPQLDERDLEYVDECVRSGWVSSAGRFIEQFEAEWARYCGRQHGIAVSNGTTALQLATLCLGLKQGDEVILPSFTIISCALAVIYAGGKPVLVDCDPETWCMDVTKLESKITSRTRAIMPVHIYGHPVDMDPVLRVVRNHGIAIVEDAAEAHGAEYLSGAESGELRAESQLTDARDAPRSGVWKKCGSFGQVSCFSFYANKLVTTGEGGMLVTDDPTIAEKARSMRNLCFGRQQRFRHDGLGYNFRMTNLQAALGVAQVERIDKIVAKKRWIGRAYTERLTGIGGVQLPCEKEWARSVYWMYGVVLDQSVGFDANEFAKRLRERGVDTRPFFLGMHAQPALQQLGLFAGESYPIADRLAKQGLYLPSGLNLSEPYIDQVCSALKESLRS